MGLAQMSALTGGKRFKRPYVDEINARKGYLPQLYAQKSEDKYRDQMYGLQKEGLEHTKTMGLANLDIAQDAAREAKKRNRTAKALGYANIGLAGALGGIKAYPALKEVGGDIMDWASPAAQTVGGVVSPSSGQDFGEVSQMGGPIDWMSDAYTDYISPAIKQLGGAAWDAGQGLYESMAGGIVDWTEGFGADEAIDFGW